MQTFADKANAAIVSHRLLDPWTCECSSFFSRFLREAHRKLIFRKISVVVNVLVTDINKGLIMWNMLSVQSVETHLDFEFLSDLWFYVLILLSFDLLATIKVLDILNDTMQTSIRRKQKCRETLCVEKIIAMESGLNPYIAVPVNDVSKSKTKKKGTTAAKFALKKKMKKTIDKKYGLKNKLNNEDNKKKAIG